MKIKAILGIGKAKVVSWGRGSEAQSKNCLLPNCTGRDAPGRFFAESILIKGRKREEKDPDECLAAGQELAIVFAN